MRLLSVIALVSCFAFVLQAEEPAPQPVPDAGARVAKPKTLPAPSNTKFNSTVLDASNDSTTDQTVAGKKTFTSDFTVSSAFLVEARPNNKGFGNTFIGNQAGFSNTTGNNNIANGNSALFTNMTGKSNIANGNSALFYNKTGSYNIASGDLALYLNSTGSYNIANGIGALYNTTGSHNIALGSNSGSNLTSGSNNIDIANAGVAGESNTIRIGASGTHTDTFLTGVVHADANSLVVGTNQLVATGGNVGIGTTSPDFPLTVQGNVDGDAFKLRSSTGADKWHLCLRGATTGDLNFVESGVADYRLYLKAGGNIGIGTNTPGARLEVNGGIKCIGAVNTSSDARFKLNLQPLTRALNQTVRLRGVSYDWNRASFPDKGFDDRRQLGFIAQEVREVLPEVVTEDAHGYLSIGYSAIIPVLAEAVKELNAKHDAALQQKDAEIAELKKRLAEVEAKDKARDARLARIEKILEEGQRKMVRALAEKE